MQRCRKYIFLPFIVYGLYNYVVNCLIAICCEVYEGECLGNAIVIPVVPT
jgi:hypothetical protein